MKSILLVDDEVRMLELLYLYLSPLYQCIKKTSGSDALQYLEKNQPDLVLLDVMMPEIDGWETCRRIRQTSNRPIIMLTARTEKADIVRGLKLGADDYITKPFDEDELLARVEAVLRRSQPVDESRMECCGLVWDENSYVLSYQGIPIPVTPKEFTLLGLFLKNPNRVFTREHLLETVWNRQSIIEDRTVDSHIRNLRDKLRQVGFPIEQFLTTVWGLGYKWMEKKSNLP